MYYDNTRSAVPKRRWYEQINYIHPYHRGFTSGFWAGAITATILGVLVYLLGH